MTSLDGGLQPIGEGPKFLEGKIDSNDSGITIGNYHLTSEAINNTGELLQQARYEGHFFSPDKVIVTIHDTETKEVKCVSVKSSDVARLLGVEKKQVKELVKRGELESVLNGSPHDQKVALKGRINQGTTSVQFGGKFLNERTLNSANLFKKAYYKHNYFSPDRVILNIQDVDSGKVSAVSMRARDVAAKLGIEKKQVKQLVKQGNLETAWEKANARNTLKNYELSVADFNQISNWYNENKSQLEAEGTSKHLKSSETGLPRTVIYIAEGPHKGLHIRSKVTVGVGSFNKATRALHLDTGKAKVARSAKVEDVSKEEIARNNEYAQMDPKGTYFATGAPVIHKGSWKKRRAIDEQVDQASLPRNISAETRDITKEANVDKVTFIMDEVPDGEMATDLYSPSRQRTTKENLQILMHLNQGLILAHRNGKVDIDYKPENVFMDSLVPKMGDFGMAYITGEQIDSPMGSPGFLSPEVLMASEDEPLTIQPGNQMWIQGCIMAMMFRGFDFDSWTNQQGNDPFNVCYSGDLANAVEYFFPQNNIEGSIDWCIAKCLAYKPEDRISAEELQPHLERIFANLA